MGPRNVEEARAMHRKSEELKATHVRNCAVCNCTERSTCEVANAYDRVIAAAAVMVETARVVDGDVRS